MTLLRSLQPFKAIYITLFILRTLPHLAILALYYAFRPFRPLPEWSFRVSLVNAIYRATFQLFTAIRYQRAPQLEPGNARERFALIEPPATDRFSGVLASRAVSPAPVGAVWHPKPVQRDRSDLADQRVVLQFTGGAFVLGWDPDQVGQMVSDVLTRNFKATNTLYAQYRLATPKTRFPAAPQDLLTVYSYVLGLGVAPQNIVLSGDSAGGNLVLALLRYLETSQTQLPSPGGAILFSPWVHVTADAGKDYECSPGSQADLLIGSLLDWGANAYLPEGGLSREAEPFVSPLHHPFKTKTPLFIQAGGGEASHGAIKEFAEEMSEVQGNQVRFHESELAPHDILLTHALLGLTAQLEAAVRDARDFFDELS